MNVKSLDTIAEDLFNKIRGRFPSVTIGDQNGEITNDPSAARFFDFDFKENGKNLGKVSISVTEDSVSVMYGNDFVENEDEFTRNRWYDFLKEIRAFAKKRLLKFDTRDITKSNLNKRDYTFLAKRNTGGDNPMSESKLYGTSKVSYQNIGSARLNIKHNKPVNYEVAAGRTQNIDRIYIESSEGERFKYPYRHIAGARAMARHVAEGGKPFDDFGSHITGLSEELYKLRKFKNYMNRSSVMAEGLADYMNIVHERIQTVKKTIYRIQKPAAYQETFETFEKPVFEEVPEDVRENWIDELTIKQFNEELADVFPYIYNLIKEGTRATDLSPEDLEEKIKGKDGKACWDGYRYAGTKNGKDVCVPTGKGKSKTKEEYELESALEKSLGQFGDKETDESNKFAPALKKARDSGEDEMEVNGKKIPVTEFILSFFDRETGRFPKGETAVLTAVEKDYGDEYIAPAKKFIEMIDNKMAEMYGYRDSELEDNTELEGIRSLAGLG